MKIFKLFIVTFCLTALLITGCKMHVGSGSKNNSGNTDTPTQDDPKDTPTTPENPPADSGDDDPPPAPKYTLENGVYLVTTENLNYVFDEIIENMPETATVYKIQLQDTELDVVKLAIQLDYLARNDEETKILLDLDFTKVTEDLVIPTNLTYITLKDGEVLPDYSDPWIFSFYEEDDSENLRSNIKKITFGDNNITLNNQCFWILTECTEIIFGDGDNTYSSASIYAPKLETITFGNGSNSIQAQFIYSDTLETVTFKKGDYTINSGAVVSCQNIKKITFDGGNINISLGNSLPELEYLDFGEANITGGFSPCFYDSPKLTTILFGNGNYEFTATSFSNTGVTELNFGTGNKLIGGGCFQSNDNLKTVDFNDGDIEFGEAAFYENPSLESVHFGKGKITMSGGTLYKCSNLTSVTFDDSVSWQITRNGTTEPIDLSDESANATAFKNGSLVKAGCVLEPVAYFLDGSYRGTMNNAKAIFQEILKNPPAEETEYKVIFTDSSWDPVALAKALDYLAQNDPETKILLDLNLSNITDDFTIPEKLTDEQMPEGDKYIFYYVNDANQKLNNVQKLTFGDSDIIVSAYGLANLSNLKEVVFGDGDNDFKVAFASNSQIQTLTIGNGSNDFESSAGDNLNKLENLNFGNGTYIFNDGAFSKTTSLKKIIFEGGTITLGIQALPASNLNYLDFGNSNIEINGGGALQNAAKLSTLKFGDGNITTNNTNNRIISYATIEELSFGKGNKTFPEGTFTNLSNLKSLNFDDGDINFANGDFGYCPNIESITFGKGTITFGYGCFNQSTEVKSLYFDTSKNWQYTKDEVTTAIDLSDPEFNAELFNVKSETSIFSNSVFTQITE